MTHNQSDYQDKLEKARLLEAKLKLQTELPHLYGWKWYKWARAFFESRNHYNFLVAANQISKSSTQIRKCIHWATARELWPSLWATEPLQFWYLYPSKEVATIEFYKKWVPQFLPRGEMKTHPVYGWREEKKDKYISALHFNSGVSIYFKTYGQDVADLQTGTCDAIFCFVAGTQVVTPQGLKGVEEIIPGDLVLSKDGFARVAQTMSRESVVITRKFSNGESLTGTREHPIWTENRGWVPFGELQPGDVCVECPSWKKLTSNSSYLKEKFTGESLGILIQDAKITGSALRRFYMSRFGKVITISAFQKALLFITETITPWIIGSKISSSLPVQSILPIISGSSGDSKKPTPINAKPAGKILSPGVLKIERLGGVLKSVGNGLIYTLQSVGSAVKSSITGKIKKTCTVLGSAVIETRKNVYNLNVEGSHTYFANGILTHNCDEELPEEIYSELNMRIQAVDGYFHMVFTATLGQEFWRETMEERGTKFERFPDAFKQQVSMYECLQYEDGTPSHWTIERIERVKNSCKSEAEILKRVYGRFILVEGRKYPAFDKKKHVQPGGPLPQGWNVYVAVDPGGGGDAHPAAICFVAVSPDCKRGRVFRGWRGDSGVTTTSDVYLKYLELKAGLDPVGKFYDYASKDFFILQSRSGDNFQQADKSHERGEQIVGVLFKNGMLTIDAGDPELDKLATELSNLRVNTPKTKAKDDFCDALRYCVVKIPWDWSAIPGIAMPEEPRPPGMGDEERERRGLTTDQDFEDLMGAFSVQEELDSINELYEA